MDIDREKEGKCLTVTVPCYNSESYLERCVESLLKERDGLEIILVDDGSTDRTGQLADQYARAYPDVVRVVHKKNGGHGSGVNAGLMLANGIYFKVVDSDDWLDEAAFHKLMSVLRFWCRTKEEKRPDLVVCNYVYDHLEDLYHYYLGREDQSVNEKVLVSRIDQQILVTQLGNRFVGSDAVQNTEPKLRRYLYRNSSIMMAISTVHLLMLGKEENPKLYRRLRLGSISGLTCLPGAPGAAVVIGGYRMARRIWQFQ